MKIDINQPMPNLYPSYYNNPPSPPNMFTPLDNKQKMLEERIAFLEKQLAEKNNYKDIDKKLSETEEGCKLLRTKYDGVTQIIIDWALTNPELAPKVSKFFDEWKMKAEEYLKTI